MAIVQQGNFQCLNTVLNGFSKSIKILKGQKLFALPCSPGSTRNAEIDGPRQFRLTTFRILAWSVLNNLTGRSQRSPRHCAVSANAIAFQLIRNGRYESIDRESYRIISQEVSDLWRATITSPVNISESFTPHKFVAALKHLKLGKVPGPDSICMKLITHAGAALKSWLCSFLSSCLHHLKIPDVWRRALVVAIPEPSKPVEDPKL